MTPRFLNVPADGATDTVALEPSHGHHRPAHVLDRRSALAINAALAAGRPLLVRGDPGMGKSQLAHAAAVRLGRALLSHAVDARTEPRDLLYTIDAVQRLADAHVARAAGEAHDLALARYVRPEILWWAFHWLGALEQAERSHAPVPAVPPGWTAAEGMVVLVDEIDKADPAIPNGLLDALGHRAFDVPGARVTMQAEPPPLVVFTTNEERTLPDAFLRRCLVLWLDLPDAAGNEAVRAALRLRGDAHFPGCPRPDVLARAAALIADRRGVMKRDRLVAPGVAEYIDLVDAVLGQPGDPLALLEEVAQFALRKHDERPA